MKQSILRLFTCLILGVVFGTTAWAADNVVIKTTTMTLTAYSDTRIPANMFSSKAVAVSIVSTGANYVKFTAGGNAVFERGWDNNKAAATYNITDESILNTAKEGNLIAYLGWNSGDAAVITITSYGAESDIETGGSTENGNTGNGNTDNGNTDGGNNTGGNNTGGNNTGGNNTGNGIQMGVKTEITGAWGNTTRQIPASSFLSDAQSAILQFVGTNYCIIKNSNTDTTVREFQWNDANKMGVTLVLTGDLLQAAKNGYLTIMVNGGSDYKLYVTNFPTETPVREQLTDLPTIYLTVPAAINKNINDVLYKDRSTNEAPYCQATIQVVDNSGSLKEFTDSKLEIKVRGNSTANGMKRPYRLKFGKDDKDPVTGEVIASHKYDLLGAGYKKRNWVLMANAFDGSMVRNALSYRVGQLVGMDFCPGWKFVDLVINEEYRGTYMVSDHIEVGKHRIEANEDTGWYIEANGQSVMAEEPYTSGGGLTLSIKNPEPAPGAETTALKSAVSTFFTDMSAKFNASNSADPTTGWRSMADEESLLAFWLGVNITANYDGFMTVKMFRDVDDPRIHFGPLWDHDLAWGNYTTKNLGHRIEEYDNGNFNQIVRKAWADPLFVKKLHTKWYQLINAGLKQDLLDYVDMLHSTIEQSEALNHQKWTTYQAGFEDSGLKTHDATIEFLKNFIDKHIDGIQDQIDAQYEALKNQMPEDGPEDEPSDDTPVGDLGALVDLGNGKYSYTGSASTFKEGTEITITTSTASTTLNNYITEGTAWNTTKTITLTASDVTTLAANSYTFYMNATGGEVKAVNAKVPEVNNAGLKSIGKEGNDNVFTYTFNKSAVKEGAKVTITLDGTGEFYAKLFTTNQWSFDFGIWSSQATYTKTLEAQDVANIIANNYTYKIVATNCIVKSVEVSGASSSGSSETPTIPTYTLALSASEGGTVSGAGTYAEGTTVLIKAIPNDGYKFVKWSDDNTYASRSVTLKEALTLTATFAAEGSADEDLFNEHGARKQFTNLPTIYLDATVGNEWSAASLEVFDADNKLGQGTSWTSSAVETQYQGSGDKNKDSYRLKFGSKTQLLSSGKFKQWVLLANDDDPTMMRNALAKEMGDALGLPFTPGYQFVDLYVNNTYMGTYQVTDRIKVESGRALVTGGNKDNDWHVRLNDAGEYNEDKPTYYIAGTTTSPYIIPKNPDPKDDETTWNSTLKSAMTTYFNNVFATDASGKYTAFAENVDKQQLFEWYIAQEMLGVYKGFSSIEAYRSVAATDKNLHIGILWDSEKAFGNTGEAPAIDMSDLNEATYKGLMTNYAAYDVMKNIFSQLWQERWFANGVNNLWKEKHEAMLTAMTSKATALKTELEGSWAQNATKWSITGEQATSIDAMKAWLTQRDAYLTKKFAALAAAVPCETHTYENHNYIEQTNGTYLIGCDVCGAIKAGSETYYKFLVYPESKESTEIIATSWHPSDEHPNSIAVVEAEKKIVEKIDGYNIVCGKKSTLSDGTKGLTCKDFRLTDGHPYYSDNKFVATTATYTRPLAENEEYGMMTLPFKHQNAENADAAFYHIASVENGKIQLVAIDPSIDGNASAYLPVIFKRKADATSITVTGADITVKKVSADKFNSTYEGWTITGAVESTSVTADGLYEMSDAKLGTVAKAESLTIAPFRAYLSTTATDTPTTLTFVCPGVTVTTLVDAIKQLTSGSLTKQDIDKIVEELLNK